MVKSVLIFCDKGPFGTYAPVEAIRLGAGIQGLGDGITCMIIFSGDGVLTLKKDLAHEKIGTDTIADGIEMGDLTELKISIVSEDLAPRGMVPEDLISYGQLSIIKRDEIPKLIGDFETAFYM